MFGLTGTEMVKEIAENTVFTPAELDKQDARAQARPLAWLISRFRQQETEDVSSKCSDAPHVTNRLADGVAHK